MALERLAGSGARRRCLVAIEGLERRQLLSASVGFSGSGPADPLRAAGTVSVASATHPTLPGGWEARDVGAAGVAGSAGVAGDGTWTVVGGGADIEGSADAFHFASKSHVGNGRIQARVTSQENTHVWAKAGPMFRHGTAANAPFAAVFITPSRGVAFQWRTTPGAATQIVQVTNVQTPRYLRLDRVGDTFRGFHSADGVTWSAISTARTIVSPPILRGGIAVTGHDNSRAGSVTFTDVSVALAGDVRPEVIGSRLVRAPVQSQPEGRHHVEFRFDRDVSASLAPAELTVRNLSTGQTLPRTAFAVSYDATRQAARFTYTPGPLPTGNYAATLSGSGVTDRLGNALPADRTTRFYVLHGDLNGDRRVDATDFNVLLSNYGAVADPANPPRGDITGDGRVDASDFNILLSNYGRVLAEPPQTRPNMVIINADDWGWPDASILGAAGISTPNIDALAREGVRFERAFVAAPTCTASRAALLTGMWPHRLQHGANLTGPIWSHFDTYTDLLADAGYAVGVTGKGHGPVRGGDRGLDAQGQPLNAAGPSFSSLTNFLNAPDSAGKPFAYWFGSNNPHRPWDNVSAPVNANAIDVPPTLPDHPDVRADLRNYYAEVEALDQQVGSVVNTLRSRGVLENTILVVTSDNGMPFARAKANNYDQGVQVPMIVSWPAAIDKNRIDAESFVSHVDLMPTFLRAAGLPVSPQVDGKDLLPLLRGITDSADRSVVFTERERHANVRYRPDGPHLAYPIRTVRDGQWLLIRNFEPTREPAGDPNKPVNSEFLGPYGDVDGVTNAQQATSRNYLLANRTDPAVKPFFELAFAKRPAFELYDVVNDPYQLSNLAGRSDTAAVQTSLTNRMNTWMSQTGDPRAVGNDHVFDDYPYNNSTTPKPPAPAPLPRTTTSTSTTIGSRNLQTALNRLPPPPQPQRPVQAVATTRMARPMTLGMFAERRIVDAGLPAPAAAEIDDRTISIEWQFYDPAAAVRA